MAFFSWIKNSFSIIWETLKSIRKYPILALPLFINWIVFASLAIYLTYYFTFPENSNLDLLIIFLILWFVSFILTFTSAIMVALVKQIETNWKISFTEALANAGSRFLPLLWLSLIWAIIWFIILIIEAILSKFKKDNESSSDKNISYESVSRTLWWANSKFSWLWLWLDVIKDLLRLAVFLSVPAILWRKKGTFWAIWEWMRVIWKHPAEFLWILGSMLFIWILMWVPLAIIFTMSDNWYKFPDWVWIITIIYEWIMWTFYMYMEQMSATLLYLWHYKWVTINKKSENWEKIPFKDVKRPSLIDNYSEFTWKKIEN